MDGDLASGSGKEKIGSVIYDHITALDVVGPHCFLGRLTGAEICFVANSLRPVHSENGLIHAPTATFEARLQDLDGLFVGGDTRGTVAAMRDPATIAFLADRGASGEVGDERLHGIVAIGTSRAA